jgi:hypothetical protein
MPKPNKNEKRKEYVSRCIAYYKKKGLSTNQAAGRCYGMWRQHKKGKKV